jgi:hypothetical protein
MKYKNTQKSIIIIGDRESVQPFGITRDFSPKDMDALPGIDAAIRKGYITPYDGKEEATEIAVSPRAATWQTEMSSGPTIKKKTAGGTTVEYVVADSDGSDSVAMSDPDTVTSLSGQKSSDYIEEGVDARKFVKHRSASEAYDEELDKENLDSEYNDEDTLAEGETERDNILDVDDEIAKDASQILIQNGKAGAQLRDVRAVVEESTAHALNDISAATRPDYDDAEVQAGAPSKVVDFLKQNFSAKKWSISKETDAKFLNDVSKVTQSENVRSLVEQRLSELSKPQ